MSVSCSLDSQEKQVKLLARRTAVQQMAIGIASILAR